MLDQVNFDEDPAAPDLRAWNFACACLFLKRYRMNLEQASCFLQGEGAHDVTSRSRPSLQYGLPTAKYDQLTRLRARAR